MAGKISLYPPLRKGEQDEESITVPGLSLSQREIERDLKPEVNALDDLFESVRAILSITPNRWNDLVSNVPAELLRRSSLPGEWSAVECLKHLIDGETHVYPVRLRAFTAGENITDYDQDKSSRAWLRQSPKQLAARFSRLRAANLKLLDTISSADLSRSSIHSTLGRVTLADFLHHRAAHDLMHLVQAERAIMQPFIAGSGSWRPYYADYDIGASK